MTLKEQKNLLVFSNEDIYREVDIDEFEKDEVLCGNTSECDIRLRIKSVEEIIIVFRKINENWHIVQNEGVYYIANGIKTPRKQLVHGDTVVVKHNIHKGELFNINYFIDFKSNVENYDLKITLNKSRDNTFGCDNGKNIFIKNELLGNSSFVVRYDEGNWVLCEDRTKYGVYVNGAKVENRQVIKDNDFITLVGHKFFFKDGFIYTSKYDNEIVVNGLTTTIIEKGNKLFKYPAFLRSPRMILNYPQDEVEILKAPNKPNEPNTNLLVTLIPLVGMVALTLAFRSGGGMSSIAFSLGSVVLTATVSLITIMQQKKNYKKEVEERIDKYTSYIEEKDKELNELVTIQRNNMLSTYQDIDESYNNVINEDRRMWERTPLHKDFLVSRLGTGTCDTSFKIKIPKHEFKSDDVLECKPDELFNKYSKVKNAPVLIPLQHAGSVGIIGNKSDLLSFMNNMTVDITSNHYYEDVRLAYITSKEDLKRIEAMKWLPHTWSNDNKMRFIATDKDEASIVLKSINKVLQDREMLIKNKDGNEEDVKDKKIIPHFVIFVTDRSLLDNEPIYRYIGKEEGLSVTFVFLYSNIEYLPKECSYVVTLLNENEGKLQKVITSEVEDKFNYSTLSDEQYISYAKKMSPIVIEDTVSDANLTNSISLFDLYNIKNINQINLNTYWSNGRVDKSMAVPLGVKLGDDQIVLDLHEKFHGPHGLVAGTTGSGKSEILQSYIASMGINFHPHDVAFIIIDFKGGGMANQFKNLPHLIGTITNIDGNQINRTLKSIEAELRRRQRLFSQFEVNHIDGYMRLYKANKDNMEPLPHLIIIADEFAELKSEQPEFMAKLISAARIGRSLGVHLILATQKPAGVVDDQIWSNSKFKLCLKVQTKEDSREMIKTDVAADIVQPGRAYLQVGNNEIFELFQSAWSGAKVYDEDDVNEKDFEINLVDLIGNRSKLYSTKDMRQSNDASTELDVVVDYINNYCQENKIQKVKGLWLPPLKSHITSKELNEQYKVDNRSWIKPLIGVYDNPDEQSQETIYFNIAEEGNVAIIGSSGSGKTTMLQTIVFNTCQNHDADDVNIYMLDFGGRTLKLLENMPQVSGVIVPEEEEKLATFLKIIKREIDLRKEKFSEYGVNSLLAYREASLEKLPHIIIAVDNFGAFNEYYENEVDIINFISREGKNLGITLVLTANQASNINYRLSANMGIKVTLRCNDKSEYSNVIDGCRMEPENVEGRGLIKIDKTVYEFQTALAVEGNSEIERAENIKELVAYCNENSTVKAKKIPEVPKVLKLSDVLENSKNPNYVVSVGVDYEFIDERKISLIDQNVINILGTSKSGKTNMIKNICKSLEENSFDAPVEMYIIDSDKRELEEFSTMYSNREYISDLFELDLIVDKLCMELDERADRVKDAKTLGMSANEVLIDEPLILLAIDNGDELLAKINYDFDLLDKFKKLVNDYSNLKFSIVIGGTEAEFGNNFSDGPKMFKNNGIGIVYSKISDQNYYDLGYISQEKDINIGDAYLVVDKKYVRVKTPIFDM